MKLTLRLLAITFIVAGAYTGATTPKAPVNASNAPSFSPPGPIPSCNPFIQNCPPIR
jgi:hypothetical protein